MSVRDAGSRDAAHLVDAGGGDLGAAAQTIDLLVTFDVARVGDDFVVVFEFRVGHAPQQFGIRSVVYHAGVGAAVHHLAALQPGDADARALHAAFGERLRHRRAPRAVHRPRLGNPV